MSKQKNYMSYLSSKKSVRTLKKVLSVTLAVTTIVWVSGIFAITPILAAVTLHEGNIIRGPDGVKVYIINDHAHGSYAGYKRHIFNPAVFGMYGHLKWSDIKTVDQATLDSYQTSDLYKGAGHEEIYSLEESGTGAIKHWIKTWADFTGLGYVMDQVFVINDNELNYTGYSTGSDLVYSAPVAAGLTVAAASDNPTAAIVISDGSANVAGSQALADMLHLKFDATTAKITTLVLKRGGISSDSDIDNVYLYDGTTKIAEMNSLSAGIVTFTNSAGLFTVSGSKTIKVLVDINKDASSGKTISFQIAGASSIVSDASAINGTFPITGNAMSIATVSDFGRLQITSQTTSATVDPGTTGFEAMKLQLVASNQNIKVYKLTLLNLGSVSTTDVTNFKLLDGGTQIGSTVAGLASDKTVTFDLSSSPLAVNSGITKTLSVQLDVVGGATRTIQLSLQRATDVQAMDASYNVYVKADSGTIGTFAIQNATQSTVNSGSLTVNLSSASPSGNIALNGTGVELAKYELKAVGEDIKISSLIVQVSSDNFAGATNWTNIKNVKLVYDGTQVGSTQSTVAEDTATTISTNFTIPAGSTKILSIQADIASASGTVIADTMNVAARLNTGATNAQRMTSLGTFNAPSGNTAGNNLTVSASALSAAKNTSQGAITAVKGTVGQLIGSYLLTAGAAEGVNVTSVVFTDDNGTLNTNGTNALGAAFTNLNLYNGATKLNSSAVVTSTGDAAGKTYTISLSPALSINTGQTVQIDLKGDVISGYTWAGNDTAELDSAYGTGKVTGTAANIAVANGKAGQGITIVTSGTLSASVDSSTPISTQMVMGGVGQTLAIWKFSASTTEDLTVSQIIVKNTTAATGNGVSIVNNLKLYVDGSQIGSTVPALSSAAANATAVFGGLSIVIPKGAYKLVTLKADVTSYAALPVSGDKATMAITMPTTITGASTDTIIARGASGNYAATPGSATYSGNDQYTYRTTITASIACSGSCSNRTRAASDTIGQLTLSGTSSADAQIRPAFQVNDEAVGTWTFTGASNGVNTTAGQFVDGSGGIRVVSAAATASKIAVDTGATGIINGYSGVSLWLYASDTVSVATYTLTIADDAALTTNAKTYVIPALTNSTLNYIDIPFTSLSAMPISTSRYIGVTVGAGGGVSSSTLDNIRFYNDKITVDIAPSASINAAAKGTPFYLKDNGGTVRGIGYYPSNSAAASVVLFGGDDIGNAAASAPTAGLLSLGASSSVYNLVTSTTALLIADTTNVETLTASLTLGNASTTGNFRWYDQAVTATSPITWFNGTSPISVSLGY